MLKNMTRQIVISNTESDKQDESRSAVLQTIISNEEITCNNILSEMDVYSPEQAQ